MIGRRALDPRGRWAFRTLITLFLIALLADLIANSKPLLASYQGTIYSPILREYGVKMGWTEGATEPWESSHEQDEPDWELLPPIPYSPKDTDPRTNGSVGPFEEQAGKSYRDRHWLGTDDLGRDLLAGMVHGTRNALLIGIGASFLATLLGVLVGALAGHFGDHRLRISRASGIIGIPTLFLAFFYAFYARGYTLSAAWESSATLFSIHLTISLAILLMGFILTGLLARSMRGIPFLAKRFRVPLDQILMRMVDALLSIPYLFLVLAVIAIFPAPSLLLLILVIGLLGWGNIARITRAEFLRTRELPYIEAVRSIGASEPRILIRHALPNVLTPILVAMSYGVAGAVLTGSALSFLGLVPGDTTFWGGILARGRDELTAWWLAVFPGAGIALLVGSFNVLAESLRRGKNQGSDSTDRKHPSMGKGPFHTG